MSDVFISYSREDKTVVERLISDLQTAEFDVYVDTLGLKPGNPDWEQALRDAIDAAGAVLLIASPDSRRSPYVRDELAIAKAKRKPIYPVWVAGEVWIDCIPMGLGHTQFVDARGDAYNAGIAQLIDALRGEPVTLADTGQSEAVTAPPIPPSRPAIRTRACSRSARRIATTSSDARR